MVQPVRVRSELGRGALPPSHSRTDFRPPLDAELRKIFPLERALNPPCADLRGAGSGVGKNRVPPLQNLL